MMWENRLKEDLVLIASFSPASQTTGVTKEEVGVMGAS